MCAAVRVPQLRPLQGAYGVQSPRKKAESQLMCIASWSADDYEDDVLNNSFNIFRGDSMFSCVFLPALGAATWSEMLGTQARS